MNQDNLNNIDENQYTNNQGNIGNTVNQNEGVEQVNQTDPAPIVNVVPTAQVNSIEQKKKSKAPLIIIIIPLLIGLGVGVYFLLPKGTDGGKTNNNSANTKKEEKGNRKEGNKLIFDAYDEHYEIEVPEEQKVKLTFCDIEAEGNTIIGTTGKAKFGLYAVTDEENAGGGMLQNSVIVDAVIKNGKLEIPKQVEGKDVLVIGGSFVGDTSNNKRFTNIFYNKYNFSEYEDKNLPIVTDIVIPNTIEELDHYAFYHSLLTDVDIPDSVKYIHGGVFNGSPLLKKVTLPKELEIVAAAAFKNCSVLESIKTRGTTYKDNVVIEKNDNIEVTLIQPGAFAESYKLKTAKFINHDSTDSSLLTVGLSYGLYNENNIPFEEIYIDGTTNINNILAGCVNLKKLSLPDLEYVKNNIKDAKIYVKSEDNQSSKEYTLEEYGIKIEYRK